MDRRFKERLIGAVVLAGAAVLILPAVLNGPHAPLPEPAEPGETALRTETIELDARPESRFTAPAATQNPAPAEAAGESADDSSHTTPEAPVGATGGPRPAEQSGSAASTPPAGAAATQEEPTQPAARQTPVTPPPAEATPAGPSRTAGAPAASNPPAPAERSADRAATGWAVQVGTFASSSNANALAARLEAGGYRAFVAPVAANGKTLYRVRVGPASDVETARAIEQRLEKDGHKADVVRLP